MVLGVAVVLAATLSGCGAGSDVSTDTPVEDETGYEIRPNDMSTFSVELPSGRKVECVVITFRGSAIQCWDVEE